MKLVCTEGCVGACLTVQRVVMELVLLYRGLWWSLSVQRVVVELVCTEGCDGACLTSYKELSSSNKGS